MPYVMIFQGEKPLGWVELTSPAVVGRSPDCQVCLMDTEVSRLHCRFEADGADWAVVDEGSRNGTWCDGVSVDRVLLLPGDRISLAKYTLIFEDGAPPATGKYQPRISSRPADPHEALAGTIAGVRVDLSETRPKDPWQAMQMSPRIRPRPMPKEPADYDPTLAVEVSKPAGRQLGLLEAAEPLATRLAAMPIRINLPTAEELRPRIELQFTPPKEDRPRLVSTAAQPRRMRVNLDFWIFLTVAAAIAAGVWTMLKVGV